MTTTTAIIYRGHLVTRLFPSGYYETFLGEGFGFIRADTLQGIKREINNFLESEWFFLLSTNHTLNLILLWPQPHNPPHPQPQPCKPFI